MYQYKRHGIEYVVAFKGAINHALYGFDSCFYRFHSKNHCKLMDFVLLLKSPMLQVLLHDDEHNHHRHHSTTHAHTDTHIEQMTMIVNDRVKVKSLIRID